MKKGLFNIVSILFLVFPAWTLIHAQDEQPLLLYFRHGLSTVDYGYMNNSRTLENFQQLFSDSRRTAQIDSVVITAYSSPDGEQAYNERLSRLRALAVKGYLVWRTPHLEQNRIHIRPRGENWAGLHRLITEDISMPYREEMLLILDAVPDVSRCEHLLRKLDGGKAYRYIEENLLKHLRNAAVCTVWMKPEGTSEQIKDRQIKDRYVKDMRANEIPIIPIPTTATVDHPVHLIYNKEKEQDRGWNEACNKVHNEACDKVYNNVYSTVCEKERHPLLAIKTNLLFDLFLIPNIELEIPIGNRWSVNAEYMFPWWLMGGDKYCLEILSGGLEGRYWLGSRKNRKNREVLTGHFLGLYAGGGKYDLQWEENGYQGEFFIAAGISYGWATRIARNLHLEFNIGIGVLRTDYRHYHAKDNYQTLQWQENGKYTWFGPTKAKISLVWLLGQRGKGGAR